MMPELAMGISTRAVAIPRHPLSPTVLRATNVGAGDFSSEEAEVQWLERFVIRLPSVLCEVLLSRSHDPQVTIASPCFKPLTLSTLRPLTLNSSSLLNPSFSS